MSGQESDGGTDSVRERAIALFTFLRAFTALRLKTTRSVEQYDSILWFSELPEKKGVSCAAWTQGSDDSGEVWLQIQKPKLPPVPRPDAVLQPWMNREQLRDSSLDFPELRTSISRRIQEEGEDRYEQLNLNDHPEIQAAWDDYVDKDWWPWRELDQEIRPVHDAYSALYAIHQRQSVR